MNDPRKILNTKAQMELDLFLKCPNARIKFNKQEQPLVSILLVTYNKAEYTFRCLKSILAFTSIPYEVVLIDNASTDQTVEMLKKVDGIKVVFNSKNCFFARATNQAANLASSPYLLLLNNDTEVLPDSIEELLSFAESHNDCGAVGPKIIWPDGKLQEAGSIIWNDGHCLGYGRGDNPLLPMYNFKRKVDYCSGAALLIKSDLFKKLNGLDTIYEPAYYEETDLCMKVRSFGLEVYYNPAASIIHYEFSSTGQGRAQEWMEKNQKIFFNKWEKTLVGDHTSYYSNHSALMGRDRAKGKNILIIDDRVPSKSEGQGFGRAVDILETLASEHRVTFVAKQFSDVEPKVLHQLHSLGVEVFFNYRDLDPLLSDREGFYDIVIASRPHNFAQSKSSIKRFLPNAKCIYDAEALFYNRAFIKNEVIGSPSLEDCEKMKREELSLLKEADRIIVVSEGEKSAIIEELPMLKDRIKVYGHALPIKPLGKSFRERKNLLFLGAFVSEDTPNVDAVHYFVGEIFPLVREKLNCKLVIAGKYPTPSVLELESEDIEVKGFVEDIESLYDDVKLFIIPHRYAGGIPFKLSEALSYGLPCVVTKLIADQMGLNREQIGVGNSPEAIAEEIFRLYGSEHEWNKSRNKGLEFIERTHDPITNHKGLLGIVNEL